MAFMTNMMTDFKRDMMTDFKHDLAKNNRMMTEMAENKAMRTENNHTMANMMADYKRKLTSTLHDIIANIDKRLDAASYTIKAEVFEAANN